MVGESGAERSEAFFVGRQIESKALQLALEYAICMVKTGPGPQRGGTGHDKEIVPNCASTTDPVPPRSRSQNRCDGVIDLLAAVLVSIH